MIVTSIGMIKVHNRCDSSLHVSLLGAKLSLQAIDKCLILAHNRFHENYLMNPFSQENFMELVG